MNQYQGVLKHSIEGYLNGHIEKAQVIRGTGSRLNDDLFRGKALDRINIITNIFTQEDCDDLINFLKIVKHCFPENK